jgi:hypothetical protein
VRCGVLHLAQTYRRATSGAVRRSSSGADAAHVCELDPAKYGPCATDVMRSDASRSVVDHMLRGHLEISIIYGLIASIRGTSAAIHGP